jgi:hypothetical protein
MIPAETVNHPAPRPARLRRGDLLGKDGLGGALRVSSPIERLQHRAAIRDPDDRGATPEETWLLGADAEPAELFPALRLGGEMRAVLRVEVRHRD